MWVPCWVQLQVAVLDILQGGDGAQGDAIAAATAATGVGENFRKHAQVSAEEDDYLTDGDDNGFEVDEAVRDERPLTPRSQARREAEAEFESIREHLRAKGIEGQVDVISMVGESAYNEKQREIAIAVMGKQQRGQVLTPYETQVLQDYRISEITGFGLFVAGSTLGRIVGPALGRVAGLFTTEAATATAAGVRRSVWKEGPVIRGVIIEKLLGQNLHQNFPVIDRFKNGIIASIKSLDLNAVSYQRPAALTRIVKGYIDKVSSFRGATLMDDVVKASQIHGRALDLAVPHSGSAIQQMALQQMREYATSQGVKLNIITIH
jgi:hypothetical protein